MELQLDAWSPQAPKLIMVLITINFYHVSFIYSVNFSCDGDGTNTGEIWLHKQQTSLAIYRSP